MLTTTAFYLRIRFSTFEPKMQFSTASLLALVSLTASFAAAHPEARYEKRDIYVRETSPIAHPEFEERDLYIRKAFPEAYPAANPEFYADVEERDLLFGDLYPETDPDFEESNLYRRAASPWGFSSSIKGSCKPRG